MARIVPDREVVQMLPLAKRLFRALQSCIREAARERDRLR
jgi:hypothetical protein